MNIITCAKKAKVASLEIAKADTATKNNALSLIAKGLEKHQKKILKANQEDISHGKANGLSESLIDRLSLQGRLEGIISDLQNVISLPDPIGMLFDQEKLPNGLKIVKCRVPIGVLGVIFESRPNVTVDVSALTIKSGNAAILRGGKEALHTNQVLVELIQEALKKAKLPEAVIQLLPSQERKHLKSLLRLHEWIDLIIPRGGAALHKFCKENSTIPVITGGIGVCHLFLDASADLKKALPIILNAKLQRPTVCNALDTLLIHRAIAKKSLSPILKALSEKGVSFRLEAPPPIEGISYKIAKEEDWQTEWLGKTLGIRIVKDVREAISHIAKYSTGHSDGILTNTKENGDLFLKEVDSSAVYLNASTRFTDGGQFGLGAEVAISTQKIHARGPMGLQELTSYKWIVKGNWTVRS